MNRLLLTSVLRPLRNASNEMVAGAELFHSLITRIQGPFSLRQVIRCWSLDYLAENVAVPTVVMHYPSSEEFVDELQRTKPTHVGINFVVSTFDCIPEMTRLIREHAPGATIILGGYGTVLPDHLLTPHADLICHEEGIGFLRRLFDEPLDRPVVPPHAPISAPRILSLQPKSVVGHVTGGLGCPNGCDFCSTSHYFDRRYVQFLRTGRDVYEALLATRDRASRDGVEMSSFILVDEDFFLHQRRAREFLKCVREGGEPLSIMGFGSVRGISGFEPKEIAEMGFELLWNGYEGARAGYAKLNGKPPRELYAGLSEVGCGVIASMIIGFPYQDAEIIRSELQELLSMEPAMVQCLIRFAFPGTPLHAEVVKESCYRPELNGRVDLRTFDGFSMHFTHPKFSDPSELEAIQEEAYRADFEQLGPGIMRLGRVWLKGYLTLRNDPNELLRKRATVLSNRARGVLPVLETIRRFAPSETVANAAARLRADLITHTGELTAGERATEAAAPTMYGVTSRLLDTRLLLQPGLLRVTHRMPDSEATQHTSRVFGLQPGLVSGLASAIGGHLAPSETPGQDLSSLVSLEALNRTVARRDAP